jgi:hypothetical protein
MKLELPHELLTICKVRESKRYIYIG